MLEATDFLEQSLIAEGRISPEQLDEARESAAETGGTVIDALVSLGHVDGRAVAVAKAQLCETAFVDLKSFDINFENARLLPKSLAERHRVFPLFVMPNVVTLGTDDPLNLAVLDDVRQILKCEIDPVQCESKALETTIAHAYGLGLGDTESPHAGQIRHDAGGAYGLDEDNEPVIRAVNTILNDAIQCSASDIHVNPDQNELHIRFRIDGRLQKRRGPALSMHTKIVQRLKVMANLDLTQTRRPQDGKFRFTYPGGHVDVRMSVIPTVTGENVVLRILAGQSKVGRLDQLGMRPEVAEPLERIASQPYGMLLVTGPTGSGKTTTLYSILDRLNTPESNVLTIEDPVEIRMPLVRQVQINPEIGLTFANALRSILRQDPDVVLVGEIRDEDTAEIALQAALTGHFVLSTLHTNDSASAVVRLTEFGQPPFVINSAVLGVVAQRLVRKVCLNCAEPDSPEPYVLELLEIDNPDGLRKGKGCRHCMHTGCQGRLGIYELLRFSPTLKDAVNRGEPTEVIRQISVREGTRLMWRDGADKVRAGLVPASEILRVVQLVEDLDPTESTHGKPAGDPADLPHHADGSPEDDEERRKASAA